MVKKKTTLAKRRMERGETPMATTVAPAFPLVPLLLATVVVLMVRVLYVTTLSPYGLGPDEAQYWHWSTRLEWSYLTKPPLVAWAIGASTLVFGKTLLGVKAFALLGQAVVALLGAAMAWKLADGKRKPVAAWFGWGLFTTVPLVAAGGLLMSPDALLLPLWMGALLLLLGQVEAKKLAWLPWVGIGVLIGLAGLAKYTAALFYPLLLLVMVVGGQGRLFAKPQVYVAGVISLAMQAPVLWWNYTHGWVGFEHVLWQTDGGGDSRHGGLKTMGEFLGSQALVLGPLVLLMLLCAWKMVVWKAKDYSASVKALMLFTLPVFAVFLAQTLNAKVQPNWPLLGTIPALVLVAALVAGSPKRWLHAVLGVALGWNITVSLVLHDTFMVRMAGLEFRHKIDPTKDMRGLPEMGQMVGLLMTRLEDGAVVLTSRYQTTAQLAFHTPPKFGKEVEVIYQNPGDKRPTQYDLWTWPALQNKLVLYVNEQNTMPEKIAAQFGYCEAWQPLAVEQRGIEVRRLYTWLCWQTLMA